MDGDRTVFIVAFPEARKFRVVRIISGVCFLLVWFQSGVALFGTAELPKWPVFIVAGLALVLAFGLTMYERRKWKGLALVINRRFAEEFTAHTGYDYPQDVDILRVERSIAVRRPDGAVLLWGVSRSKVGFTVFPMS
ncbi:hypothetical protein ACSBOX_05840 [Arthrobacter sp. KN11-1C]|uniref:hypothetical protein n=1 Tax=Arthrobacter sp. KN11-1C TaxID=3445774 RepID=UPI003F9ED7EF